MGMEKEFYLRDPGKVAEDLLGDHLVKGEVRGRIVETEAYLGEDDPASHAYSGKTERTELMFDTAGKAYVYLCYGMHDLFNVTAGDGEPGAVLVRAVEPLEGIETMKTRRGRDSVEELCDGPGKVCEAFGIGREDSGTRMSEGELRIEPGEEVDAEISTRIGVSGGEDMMLRFFESNSEYVSNP